MEDPVQANLAHYVSLSLYRVLHGIYAALDDKVDIVKYRPGQPYFHHELYNHLHARHEGDAGAKYDWIKYIDSVRDELVLLKPQFNQDKAAEREYNFTLSALLMRQFYHVWKHDPSKTVQGHVFKREFILLCKTLLKHADIDWERGLPEARSPVEFVTPYLSFTRKGRSIRLIFDFLPLDWADKKVSLHAHFFKSVKHGRHELRIGCIGDSTKPSQEPDPILKVVEGEDRLDDSSWLYRYDFIELQGKTET
ncbi:hypothetical protein H0H93_005903 [Arthromyces matolae]|nr:hypothetical protein H0H93_005903 [Arthromyces matolae]